MEGYSKQEIDLIVDKIKGWGFKEKSSTKPTLRKFYKKSSEIVFNILEQRFIYVNNVKHVDIRDATTNSILDFLNKANL